MKLDVQVDTAAAEELLRVIAEHAVSLRPALLDVAEEFRTREEREFDTAGEGRWHPVKLSTARRKRDRRVLVDTGRLLESLTVRGSRYNVETVTDDAVVMGTSNPVAQLHKRGARGMPVRNPVPPLTDQERRGYAEILLTHVVRV